MADEPPRVNRFFKRFYRKRGNTVGGPAPAAPQPTDNVVLADTLRRKSLDPKDVAEVKQMMVRSAFLDQLCFVTKVLKKESITEAERAKVKQVMKKTTVFHSVREKIFSKPNDDENKMASPWEGISKDSAIASYIAARAAETQPGPSGGIFSQEARTDDTTNPLVAGIMAKFNESAGTIAPQRKRLAAMFAYQAKEKDELSISRGDKVEVIEEQEDGWYLVEHVGSKQVGLVPGNFLGKFQSEPRRDDSSKSQNSDISGLLNKKTLTSSEAKEIRDAMTMLATDARKKSILQPSHLASATGSANRSSTFSVDTLPRTEMFMPNNMATSTLMTTRSGSDGVSAESNVAADKETFVLPGPSLGNTGPVARHMLQFWNPVEYKWTKCEVVLDEKMKVLFAHHVSSDVVHTIHVTCDSAVAPVDDPNPNFIGGKNERFCFQVNEDANGFFLFSTHEVFVFDSILAQLNFIIDREVETNLDGLIIFGDKSDKAAKESRLRRASLNAMERARNLFPKRKSSDKCAPLPRYQEPPENEPPPQDTEVLIDTTTAPAAMEETLFAPPPPSMVPLQPTKPSDGRNSLAHRMSVSYDDLDFLTNDSEHSQEDNLVVYI